jgi:cytochrome c oxidase cbb3-type subunit III
MYSGCRERRAAALMVLVACVAGLCVACSREQRRFDEPLSSGARSGISLSELQPGAATPPKEVSSPYAYNAYAIAQGKRLFDWYNCSGCHAHGGGDIGPPLMDDRWIYGSAPGNVFATVVEGRPNGMPSFRDHLNDTQIWQLVAYVQSLGGQLPRDALPARSDHLFDKPGEQSLPRQPQRESSLPPDSQR